MQQPGTVKLGWRELLALSYARAVLASPPPAALPRAEDAAQVAAWRQAGGVEAFAKLSTRARERLLAEEGRAMRSALARLGDLGLIAWEYQEEESDLAYRLTGAGKEACGRGPVAAKDNQVGGTWGNLDMPAHA